MSRDELARDLAALRRTRPRLGAGEVGRHIGVAQSTISRWESGRFAISAEHVEALAAFYEVDADTRARWLTASREGIAPRQRVFVHRPDDAAGRQRGFGERERDSIRITTLGATVVPGLLQTERVMRAIVTSGGRLGADRIEEWVANRLWRQRILTETGREFLQLVLPGALLWCADSPEAMLEQLDHLAVASRLPHVRLGIVPIGRTVDAFPLHNIDSYVKRDGAREVVVGTLAGTQFLDSDDDVAAHDALLGRIERLAVFDEEARAELDRVAGFYR